MAATQTTRLGTWLFRLRSFTPVPVILLLLLELWRSRGAFGPGGPAVDHALNWLGLGVALAGQALRFYTLGQARDGTSGQGYLLESTALNTRGPYAHVRNPLYLGNFGIVLGLMLIAHDPLVYAVGLVFFFGQYFFIIRAEEAFLEQQHGEPYRDFLRKVPRWIPRLGAAYPGKLHDRFDWARALKKEHNPFAAWAIGGLVLCFWELSARGELDPTAYRVLVTLFAAVAIAFVGIKAWKRRWLAPTRA